VVLDDPLGRAEWRVRPAVGQPPAQRPGGRVEAGLGEDVHDGREAGRDRGGVVGQLLEVHGVARLGVAEVGVEELDEGLEAKPVGDWCAAGGGVLSRPGRPSLDGRPTRSSYGHRDRDRAPARSVWGL
jgi:hypothetical protein